MQVTSINGPLYIGKDMVYKFLTPEYLFEPLKEVLATYSKSKSSESFNVVQPVRSIVEVSSFNGFLGVMPAYIDNKAALATKLVTFYPENSTTPTHQAWIMTFDPHDGSLLAMIEGNSVTEIRTAVTSAIATKFLAKPDSSILAILGSGVQARSHLKALSTIFSFQEIRIWSRTTENAEKLSKEVGAKCCGSVQEAVEGADVICTVSFATKPIVRREWIKSGAHINAVGAARPDWQELDEELMRSAIVYCDSLDACLKEAGDVIISKCDVYGEIGEVINGDKIAYQDKTTVFKSLGMAVEDAISAKLIYDKYVKEAN